MSFSRIDGSATWFACADFLPALAHSDAIYFAGTPTVRIYSFVFGAPVRDPIIHLQSLASRITFTNPVTRLSGNATFAVNGNAVSGVAVNDPNICGGTDSVGSIRIEGTFRSLSFTVQYANGIDGIRLQLGGTVIHPPRLALAPDGSGGFFIHCGGVAGFAYQLQRAANVTGPWTSLATATAPPSGLLEFHDTNGPPGQAFYRAVQQ